MDKARLSRNTLLLWLLCIAVGIVALLVWMPSGDSDKSPYAKPFVTGFLLLLLIILFLARQDQSLGREMQGPETTEEVRRPPVIEEAIEDLPVPPFALEVITPDSIPPLSPDAARLVERGRDLYRQRLRIERQGVWFLSAAHLAIALLGGLLGSPYPLPSPVATSLFAVFLALIVLAPPDRIRLILVPVAWRGLRLACIAAMAVLAALYAVRGAVIPALLAAGAIVAHMLIARRRERELRRAVAANPPVKLLFLWVFDSLSPAFLFLGFAAVWRFLGTIQLLNGAGFMGDSLDIARSFARGKSASLIVKTPEELSARLRSFEDAPGAMAMYPHHTLLCNDAVWKSALHRFLDQADAVLMDLRGFSPANQGATYELGQLVDGFPTARFVLLTDGSTDVEFLSESLRNAWTSMAAGSPNRRAPVPVRLFHLGHGAGAEGQFPQLPSIAREGDRLVELLCERAAAS